MESMPKPIRWGSWFETLGARLMARAIATIKSLLPNALKERPLVV